MSISGRAKAVLFLIFVALAGVLIGGVTVWSVDRARPGGAEEARIGAVVRDYVLAHPDLIPQAVQRLQDRETGKLVAANRAAIETPFGSAWIGNPKGDVTVVEYFDYNCGYCRAALPTIAKLVAADPRIRVVFRELPVLGPTSRPAAEASLAAAAQGRFAAFHDALYAAGPVSEATIAAAAQKAGVRTGAPPDADAEIDRNMKTASQLGMTGTPSWVIGDRVLSGAQPIEELQKAIAAARTRG